MADKQADKAPDKVPFVDNEFRRAAALAILEAFITRHGGFEPVAREAHLRQVWEYADLFVRLEHAPPPPPPVVPEMTRPKRRAVAPDDEWAVRDGDNYKRGFVSLDEAEFYAAARPGAEVVQVSGAGARSVSVAAG